VEFLLLPRSKGTAFFLQGHFEPGLAVEFVGGVVVVEFEGPLGSSVVLFVGLVLLPDPDVSGGVPVPVVLLPEPEGSDVVLLPPGSLDEPGGCS